MTGYVPCTHGCTVIIYMLKCEIVKQTKVSSFFSVTDSLEPAHQSAPPTTLPSANSRENTVSVLLLVFG